MVLEQREEQSMQKARRMGFFLLLNVSIFDARVSYSNKKKSRTMNIDKSKMLIFIGIPASGKTSFYNHFYKKSYRHINLDTLKTRYQENLAINECIKNNIMKDFLLKHRGEVTNVILSTYYKEVHEKGERDFYKDYGKKLHLISQVQKKFQKNLNAFAIAESLEESVETINQIMHTIKDNPDADLEHLYYLIYRQ